MLTGKKIIQFLTHGLFFWEMLDPVMTELKAISKFQRAKAEVIIPVNEAYLWLSADTMLIQPREKVTNTKEMHRIQS